MIYEMLGGLPPFYSEVSSARDLRRSPTSLRHHAARVRYLPPQRASSSENFNVMYDRILRSPLAFRPEAAFTPAARDLLEGLLQKEPEKRLGSGETDGAELRQHAWFPQLRL